MLQYGTTLFLMYNRQTNRLPCLDKSAHNTFPDWSFHTILDRTTPFHSTRYHHHHHHHVRKNRMCHVRQYSMSINNNNDMSILVACVVARSESVIAAIHDVFSYSTYIRTYPFINSIEQRTRIFVWSWLWLTMGNTQARLCMYIIHEFGMSMAEFSPKRWIHRQQATTNTHYKNTYPGWIHWFSFLRIKGFRHYQNW
jgi:hypothetical protein